MRLLTPKKEFLCDECGVSKIPLIMFEAFSYALCKKCLYSGLMLIEDSESGIYQPTLCLHCNEISNKVDSPQGCNACGNEWL